MSDVTRKSRPTVALLARRFASVTLYHAVDTAP
jgi:hypothetical protein